MERCVSVQRVALFYSSVEAQLIFLSWAFSQFFIGFTMTTYIAANCSVSSELSLQCNRGIGFWQSCNTGDLSTCDKFHLYNVQYRPMRKEEGAGDTKIPPNSQKCTKKVHTVCMLNRSRCVYWFKLYIIRPVDSKEYHENGCHQRSDFMAKMHQIRFRPLGKLTALPRPSSWI